jgi:hypothetical protein
MTSATDETLTTELPGTSERKRSKRAPKATKPDAAADAVVTEPAAPAPVPEPAPAVEATVTPKAAPAPKVKPTHYFGRLAEQHGVKAPQREGSIATAWALFDGATGTIYTAHLPQLAELHGLNLGNLQIELNRWRKFNGIAAPGRMPKPEAAAE